MKHVFLVISKGECVPMEVMEVDVGLWPVRVCARSMTLKVMPAKHEVLGRKSFGRTYRVIHPVLYAVDFPTAQANSRAFRVLDVVVEDGGAATPAANPCRNKSFRGVVCIVIL